MKKSNTSSATLTPARALSRALMAAMAIVAATPTAAQAFVDTEAGIAFTGYNDAAIPADTGTRVSLAKVTPAGPVPAFRMRVGYTFADRHTVSVLAAPLTIKGRGKADYDISYQDTLFPAGEELTSIYRFDSYRLTYRWDALKSDRLKLGIGLTGKIRSADIAIAGDSGYANRTDLGVVPLVNFLVDWNFAGPFSLLVDGDALASPYGRAEDVLAALTWKKSDSATLRIGYRVLEGGSDGGGNVYTFALFHYASAGVTITF
jgi:hypothetical protein